jgi:hypothetical protein
LTGDQKILMRKLAELARVFQRLRAPDMSPGIIRELRKQAAALQQEAALETA